MEANYNFYKIDVADIWQFERSLFLSDKTHRELAQEIIDKVESSIIKYGNPVYGIDYRDNKDEKIRAYYERNKREHGIASKNLEERYSIDFFFNKHLCFQYNQPIIIEKEDFDFDFWFVLKLRQYDSKLSEIKNFLNFQLEANFNNDINEFVGFLTIFNRQHQAKYLQERVVDTVEEWIDSLGVNKKINKKGERKMAGKINSLSLKILKTHPEFFQKAENRKNFEKILFELQDEKFISKNVAKDNFIAIFGNKEISKKKRIIWLGTNVELSWFMRYLVYESNKVEVIKNDIWLVAVKCFVKHDGSEYSEEQLRKASGDKLDRKEKLKSLLSRL